MSWRNGDDEALSFRSLDDDAFSSSCCCSLKKIKPKPFNLERLNIFAINCVSSFLDAINYDSQMVSDYVPGGQMF